MTVFLSTLNWRIFSKASIWMCFRELLADFLMVLTGGPDIYKGRDLREAHEGFGITEVDFNRLMTHVAGAAEELQIEPQDIATVAAAIIDLKDQVVTA